MRILRVAVASLLVLALAPSGAEAHGGLLCGFSGVRLEGECYSHAATFCDPASDGEHVRVLGPDALYSGTRAAFLPETGCYVTFASVSFSSPGRFTTYGATATGGSEALTIAVRVSVDGVLHATDTFVLVPQAAPIVRPLDAVSVVSTGTHAIRVEYTVVHGPRWANLFLDWLDRTVDCANAAPSLPVVTGADGIGSGAFGWSGAAFPYVFSWIGSSDAEGDPIVYRWEWGDGTTSPGATNVHAFLNPGAHPVRVVATDDPTWRGCHPLTARTSYSAPFSFTAMPDWTVRLHHPRKGFGCIFDQEVPGVGAQLMVGPCVVTASVETGGPSPAAVVEHVVFVRDATPVVTDPAPPYVWPYDSGDWPDGTAFVELRAKPVGDKFLRTFASEPYVWYNVPV